MPLIDRTTGTTIGSMTDGSGLAAAFDGDTTQQDFQGATASGTTSGFVGKTLAVPSIFSCAIIYGSSNEGFCSGGSDITINIRGKQGVAPASEADGTIIGTISFTDQSDESAGRLIASTDLSTVWDHIFAEIIRQTGVGRVDCAELVLHSYEPNGMIALLL